MLVSELVDAGSGFPTSLVGMVTLVAALAIALGVFPARASAPNRR